MSSLRAWSPTLGPSLPAEPEAPRGPVGPAGPLPPRSPGKPLSPYRRKHMRQPWLAIEKVQWRLALDAENDVFGKCESKQLILTLSPGEPWGPASPGAPCTRHKQIMVIMVHGDSMFWDEVRVHSRQCVSKWKTTGVWWQKNELYEIQNCCWKCCLWLCALYLTQVGYRIAPVWVTAQLFSDVWELAEVNLKYNARKGTFTIYCDSHLLTRFASLTSSTLRSGKTLHK